MSSEILEKSALEIAKKAKKASLNVRSLSTIQKNKVLQNLIQILKESESDIISENKKDMDAGTSKGISDYLLDRLLLDAKRLSHIYKSIEEIINLPDPVGEVVRGITLANGLELITKRVPIGVVMTIFESRPNVIIDIASLSFKSGNSCILRGGSEAFHSNRILSSLFHKALKKENIDPSCVCFVENTEREAMVPFFQLDHLIDLIVPRGGEALIKFVSENSKIPVVKHDKGVTNLFVDASADPKIVVPVIINSKTQRPGVCNALENLILHKDYPYTKELFSALEEKGVSLLVEENLLSLTKNGKPVREEDYDLEFLDLRLSVKTVSDLEEAIPFIQSHTSGHTECILTESASSIHKFQTKLDSAAIFVNCSTRFHDGGEFGLGAEVGISTGKLHVRGPMGLIHLTTTTTFVTGSGQVRS